VSRNIAFFDFDGTITVKDTLAEFIKYSKGKHFFFLGCLLTSPWVLAYKLKFISNQRAKESVLAFFFRKSTLERFQEHCDRFSKEVLPDLIRPKALREIEKLRENNFAIVIVSASPENWIRGWTAGVGVSLIASRLQTNGADLRLTGKIEGKNCHGQEKVRRIRQEYDLSEYMQIFSYGDTRGDRPMLGLGTHSFYRPFR
jgi:phosphatidylglycerophosphatase C